MTLFLAVLVLLSGWEGQGEPRASELGSWPLWTVAAFLQLRQASYLVDCRPLASTLGHVLSGARPFPMLLMNMLLGSSTPGVVADQAVASGLISSGC